MQKKWYNIYNSSDRKGSLTCPNCNHVYDEQMIYFFEPNHCPTCNHHIGFINISPYKKDMYIIDLEEAPEVFEIIFDYLSKENHKKGFSEMRELIELFNLKS